MEARILVTRGQPGSELILTVEDGVDLVSVILGKYQRQVEDRHFRYKGNHRRRLADDHLNFV